MALVIPLDAAFLAVSLLETVALAGRVAPSATPLSLSDLRFLGLMAT